MTEVHYQNMGLSTIYQNINPNRKQRKFKEIKSFEMKSESKQNKVN